MSEPVTPYLPEAMKFAVVGIIRATLAGKVVTIDLSTQSENIQDVGKYVEEKCREAMRAAPAAAAATSVERQAEPQRQLQPQADRPRGQVVTEIDEPPAKSIYPFPMEFAIRER